MQNTKANVVKVLESLSKHSMDMARIEKKQKHKTLSQAYIQESIVYDRAIGLLTDQKYFDDICKILKIGDD